MITDSEIESVFKAMLGRSPETRNVYEHFRHTDNVLSLVEIVSKTPEFLKRSMKSPFDYYNSRIDALSIVRSHENSERQQRPGYKVNYFGVSIPNAVIPSHAFDQIPDLENDPLPANWHADTAEFAAALRSVDLAKSSFTMIELGCGWGCWMNITGAAAKRRGKVVKLIGIEGDGKNIGLARDALAANGFLPEEYSLLHGIAHASSGFAAFPQQNSDEENWGFEPVFSTNERAFAAAMKSGRHAKLPMYGFRELSSDYGRIDLLHVDIQGGEAALVRDSIHVFSEKIAYVLIGTHSRQIEGEVFNSFLNAGWVLEIERPAILSLQNAEAGPSVTVDGVQGWRNPRLA
ncbi:MAG: class I SAM-dependent methyltransferase [Parvularculaceae bacterium]